MSWIDKELRKRQKALASAREAGVAPPADDAAGSESERIKALWQTFEAANAALPEALRLKPLSAAGGSFPPELAMLSTVLMAGNGAGVGFSGRAVRYFWPKANANKSNNFWITCDSGSGFLLNRRIRGSALGSTTDERRFNEGSIDHIFKCLVTGKRVSWRSVGKRRFWLF